MEPVMLACPSWLVMLLSGGKGEGRHVDMLAGAQVLSCAYRGCSTARSATPATPLSAPGHLTAFAITTGMPPPNYASTTPSPQLAGHATELAPASTAIAGDQLLHCLAAVLLAA